MQHHAANIPMSQDTGLQIAKFESGHVCMHFANLVTWHLDPPVEAQLEKFNLLAVFL
jgi:hypothetical protein